MVYCVLNVTFRSPRRQMPRRLHLFHPLHRRLKNFNRLIGPSVSFLALLVLLGRRGRRSCHFSCGYDQQDTIPQLGYYTTTPNEQEYGRTPRCPLIIAAINTGIHPSLFGAVTSAPPFCEGTDARFVAISCGEVHRCPPLFARKKHTRGGLFLCNVAQPSE